MQDPGPALSLAAAPAKMDSGGHPQRGVDRAEMCYR